MPAKDALSTPMTISKQDARRFMLAHHHLWPPRRLKGKSGILDLVRHLGCIQFDSINVVGRNADLMLQARVANYRPVLLEELLYRDRSLIDGWDKMASIFPIQDWPYFNWRREIMIHHHRARSQQAVDAAPEVLQAIAANGATSSLDFDEQPRVDWYWSETKLARAAMEALYEQGRIGITHRVNTRRYFDLIERLLPPEILKQPGPHSTLQGYQDWHLERRIGSMGLASMRAGEHWLGIVGMKSAERRESLERLLKASLVRAVQVDGLQEVLYIRSSDMQTLARVQNERAPSSQAALIAPLDNLIWNRRLIKDVFGYEYIWEVYKPKHQRQYGYYVLPLIYGEDFIGRIDPAYDRKKHTLMIKGVWWEADIQMDEHMISALRRCLHAFKEYLGAKRMVFEENAAADGRLQAIIES